MIDFTFLKPVDNQKQAGFTIIELMIATGIFTAILLLAVLTITKSLGSYYKVSIDSSASSTVQSVTSDVEQAIQASSSTGSGVTWGAGYLCTPTEEFAYNLGGEMPVGVPNTTPRYALYQFPLEGNSCSNDPVHDLSAAMADGQSLLSTHYRLLDFKISQVNLAQPEYSVDIKIAYTAGGQNDAGDDLLCDPSIGCGPSAAPLTSFNSTDQCKNEAGEQYCDIEELQGVVGTHAVVN